MLTSFVKNIPILIFIESKIYQWSQQVIAKWLKFVTYWRNFTVVIFYSVHLLFLMSLIVCRVLFCTSSDCLLALKAPNKLLFFWNNDLILGFQIIRRCLLGVNFIYSDPIEFVISIIHR
jgi:hypothetical protein